MAEPSMSLRVVVNDVTSRISLDKVDPVLDLTLGLRIPLLDLVSLLAEFQQNHASQQSPASGNSQGQPWEAAKAVPPPAGFPSRLSAPPPPPPPASRAAAVQEPSASGSPSAEKPDRGPAAAPGESTSASTTLSGLISAQPPASQPPPKWDDDISELQPSHQEYRDRAKWAAAGAPGNRGASAEADAAWKLSDKSCLLDFQPLPLQRTRPGCDSLEPTRDDTTPSRPSQPPPLRPPPASELPDGRGAGSNGVVSPPDADEAEARAKSEQRTFAGTHCTVHKLRQGAGLAGVQTAVVTLGTMSAREAVMNLCEKKSRRTPPPGQQARPTAAQALICGAQVNLMRDMRAPEIRGATGHGILMSWDSSPLEAEDIAREFDRIYSEAIDLLDRSAARPPPGLGEPEPPSQPPQPANLIGHGLTPVTSGVVPGAPGHARQNCDQTLQ